MSRKIIYSCIFLTLVFTVFPASLGEFVQPLQGGEYIDYLSGWLKYDTHCSEIHCVYKQWGYPGPGADIIEIINFGWDDPNTRLIVYFLTEDYDEITNEMWAGGRVDYRYIDTKPYYTYWIKFYYHSYYGDEPDEPDVIYDGFCNLYGPDSDVP